MNTRESLNHDLKQLGIKKGDTLFLRISFRALGKTEGGPSTVIDALIDVIGPSGTLIAAAFPKRQLFRFPRKKVYEQGKHMTTGVIPQFMSKRQDAFFSSHPIAPFVCIGKNARVLTELHTAEKHNFALIKKAIDFGNAKCLRIGGDVLIGSTHIAFSEGLKNSRQYHIRKPEGLYYFDGKGKLQFKYQDMAFFCKKGFENFCNQYIYSNPDALLAKGKIGQGEAFLTDMGVTLEIERKWIAPNPQILLCDDPECMHCRSAYSYSDYFQLHYILKLIKMKLKGNYTRGHLLRDIKDILILIFFGRKCQ